jgi:hypothetical protein
MSKEFCQKTALLLTQLLNDKSDIVKIRKAFDDLYYSLEGQDMEDDQEIVQSYVYPLVDVYIDSIIHGFKSITPTYSISDLEADINFINNALSAENIESLLKNQPLQFRIRDIYRT